jgi:hypothetical protein
LTFTKESDFEDALVEILSQKGWEKGNLEGTREPRGDAACYFSIATISNITSSVPAEFSDHGNTANWTSIIQYSCSTDSNMQWQPELNVKPARLKNKKDLTKCMDLDHGNTNDWNPLVLYKCSTDSNMYWRIDPQ